MDRDIKHWSEILAEKAIERSKDKDKVVITGGITTSGPAHLGTVCEFLYPSTIKKAVESKGKKAEMYFVGDIMDAFDDIPLELKQYAEQLKPELGKPLVNVPDPLGCHKSYGEHYLSEVESIMKKMNLDIKVVKASDIYASGGFDEYTKKYLENEDKIKEIVARTSFRKIENMQDWSVIMPICENCGKIATTRVIWHDSENYEYICDKDVGYTKGCGYRGKNNIKEHKYKLQWRLHWPAWQMYFNTDIEGAGVDHMTRGGSKDTSYAILKEFFNREPPVYYKYGFVLFHGKKMSKSKGIGVTATHILKLIPPELLMYMLVVPELEHNKDIDPNGDKLIYAYDDLERIASLDNPTNRADVKKKFIFNLIIKNLHWHVPFTDILTTYQIYHDWNQVKKLLNDEEGVDYLAPYITNWIEEGYVPDKYKFNIGNNKINEYTEEVKDFINRLNSNMNPLDIHNLVYAVSKEKNIEPSKLFSVLYKGLIGKDTGPRFGKLVYFIGVEKAKEILNNALSN